MLDNLDSENEEMRVEVALYLEQDAILQFNIKFLIDICSKIFIKHQENISFFYILFKNSCLKGSNSTTFGKFNFTDSRKFNPLEFEGFEITIKKRQEIQNDKNYCRKH